MTVSVLEIARCFPRARGLFTYGSAAFQQPGLYRKVSASRSAPMLDMLFAADNPLAWHREVCVINHTYKHFSTQIFRFCRKNKELEV